MSNDGYAWARFESDYRLAVDPVFVAGKGVTEAVLLASLTDTVDRSRIQLPAESEHPTRTQASLPIPYPNPFNPRTVIQLELAQAGSANS